MKKFLIVVFVVTLVGSAYVFNLYKQVEQSVLTKLHGSPSNHLPAIVSNYELYTSNHRLTRDKLLQLLKDRHYREVHGRPAQPGEYQLGKSTALVLTRPFSHPERTVTSPHHVVVAFDKGTIQNLDDDHSNYLLLEPVVMETLGTGTRRANNRISINKMPEWLPAMVVAIEDERFYQHSGVDPIGILRAAFVNVTSGKLVQGGSTITQQLAKNLFFSPRKTLERKVKEAMAAFALERHLSKTDILEMYLNEVYLGQEGSVAIHGVAEASKAFFGKSVQALTPAESALLAGIIQAPSYYSPRRHPERAKKRRDLVLEKTGQRGSLTPLKITDAKNAPVKVQEVFQYKRKAPYFVSHVKQRLPEGVLRGAVDHGLTIHTSLHYSTQRCAESAVKDAFPAIRKKAKRAKDRGKLQVGLVAIEPYSGLVRAWVGGQSYSSSQYDHVAQAKRQIGSTIKPFLYLTALDAELNDYRPATPISILPDRPLEIKTQTNQLWRPENYDKKFRGDVTLRYALERSLNVPAAYISTRVEIEKLVQVLRKFRIAEDIPSVPSLALGSVEAPLLNMTAAYAAIANGGIYTEPRPVTHVYRDGEYLPLPQLVAKEERVSSEAPVFVLTNILQGVLDRGTGRGIRKAGFSSPAAGKTGTSNDGRDSWFIGYTPELAIGVWVGYDDNSPTGLTGGSGAAPVWAEFMKCMKPLQKETHFIRPRNVNIVSVDPNTGAPPCPDFPHEGPLVKEVFVKGTEPEPLCDYAMAQGRFDSDFEGESQLREEWPPKANPPQSNGNQYREEYLPQGNARNRRPLPIQPRRRERSFWDFLGR